MRGTAAAHGLATVAAVNQWRNPYQWARAHPRAFDAAIAVVLIAGSYVDLATSGGRLAEGVHAPNLFTYLLGPGSSKHPMSATGSARSLGLP